MMKMLRCAVLPLSQSWFPSPSCGVKGFVLILGSIVRDFLKPALGSFLSLPLLQTVSPECDGLCIHKEQTLRNTPHVFEQTALHPLSVSDTWHNTGIGE